jgi:hypothetical protein
MCCHIASRKSEIPQLYPIPKFGVVFVSGWEGQVSTWRCESPAGRDLRNDVRPGTLVPVSFFRGAALFAILGSCGGQPKKIVGFTIFRARSFINVALSDQNLVESQA